MFVRRDETGLVTLLVAKVTNEFLQGGFVAEMNAFLDQLKDRFVAGKLVIDQILHLDGCDAKSNTTISEIQGFYV